MNTIIDHNACMGDVLAFDFNREVHHLTRDDSRRAESDDYRVTLKLHYCMYPRVLYPIGWLLHYLNVQYNASFRALFLKTINPQSLWEHFLAWNVVVNTTVFNTMEMCVKSLPYLSNYVSKYKHVFCLLGALAFATSCMWVCSRCSGTALGNIASSSTEPRSCTTYGITLLMY
jgi:hypothetical protein